MPGVDPKNGAFALVTVLGMGVSMVDLSDDGKTMTERKAYRNDASAGGLVNTGTCQNKGAGGVWSNPRGIAIDKDAKYALIANGKIEVAAPSISPRLP